ncbi:MAG: helix-turn-helix domain-containing protein [Nitriliruptoraceae bacterium]|nr:helix-turn-helix domain-containing protein [Nitriliruptoraceae bacterium]
MTLDELREHTTVTVAEAGAVLGLSRNAAYAAVKAGEIPSLTFGRRVVVPVPALLRMLGADDDQHDQHRRIA